jgi:hypothetical protein
MTQLSRFIRRPPSSCKMIFRLALSWAALALHSVSAVNLELRSVDSYAPSTFTHPGVLLSRGQLDYIAAQVSAQREPWKRAFDAMMSDNWNFSSLTRNPKPTATVVGASWPIHVCITMRFLQWLQPRRVAALHPRRILGAQMNARMRYQPIPWPLHGTSPESRRMPIWQLVT